MRLGEHAVYVQDGEGTVHGFLPGQDVPAWAAQQLGPHCFADAAPDRPEPPADGDVPAVDTAGTPPPPPRAGRGASVTAWRNYADSVGVDVSAAEGRDDIIDLLEAAGIAV